MRKVLIDSSSAILLYKTGLAELLLSRFCICTAESVLRELTLPGYTGSDYFSRAAETGQVEVCSISEEENAELSHSLHQGERDTVGLYLAGTGEFIILDDRKGAWYCRKNNIPYINALLTAKIFYFTGDLNFKDFQEKEKILAAIGRYSGSIIDFVSSVDSDELSFFIRQ